MGPVAWLRLQVTVLPASDAEALRSFTDTAASAGGEGDDLSRQSGSAYFVNSFSTASRNDAGSIAGKR